MKTAKIAIIGFGTIGSGVARILLEKPELLARHAGKRLELARVVDKDLTRERNVTLPEGVLSDDLEALINDPEISVVVQLVGGSSVSREIMLRLLKSGKDVVTANKALLAHHGPELFAKARQLERTIAFEAAVGGGMPIITGIGQCLAANQIESIRAILNGTTNFILSEMTNKGSSYDNAVKEAQRLGFAEADPTMDVDGTDAAQKLAILAQLAFGAAVHWADIPRIGVEAIELADLEYAREMGYAVKLLAEATMAADGLDLHVAPTLVKLGTPMADVNGAFNAVEVIGDSVGRSFFHGLGAGQNPTASAVVADLLDVVSGRAPITFRNLDLWSQEREASVAVRPAASVPGRFYLRFDVDDRLGVMSQTAGIFSKHNVSIASLRQSELLEDSPGHVTLIVTTHEATEGDMNLVIEELEASPITESKVVRLRLGM